MGDIKPDTKAILDSKIRPAYEDDYKHLPVFSFDKLNSYRLCPLLYHLRYHEGRAYSFPLDDGLDAICRLVLHEKADLIRASCPVDYDCLREVLQNGNGEIPGIAHIKRRYFDKWFEYGKRTKMSYADKMDMFDKVLHTEMLSKGWSPMLVDYQFDYVYGNRAIISDRFDRVDISDYGYYKIVSYSVSSIPCQEKRAVTSMRMALQAFGLYRLLGALPSACEHSYFLIGKKVPALTSGWDKRITRELDGLLDKIEASEQSCVWKPCVSPMCTICPYAGTRVTVNGEEKECQEFPFDINGERKKWIMYL